MGLDIEKSISSDKQRKGLVEKKKYPHVVRVFLLVPIFAVITVPLMIIILLRMNLEDLAL